MQTSSFAVFIFSLLLCLSKGVDGNRPNDEFQDTDSDDDNRIIGGTNVTHRVPYQVSLRDNNGNHFCGGSILTKKTILTAAHCAIGNNTATVVVGTNLLSSGGSSYNINSSVIHPAYNPSTILNDIALLITEKRIVFTYGNVWPISLPRVKPTLPSGSKLVATGWGLIQLNPPVVPDYLQTLTTNTIPLPICQLIWGSYVTSNNLCVLTQFGQGLCFGDSGGPLVSKGIVHGIVSFGAPCALGLPDVLTQVSGFVPWIKLNWRF